MSASDYKEIYILKYQFRNTAPATPPTNMYVALFTVTPNEDGTGGTEVTGGAYARVAVTTGTSGSGAGSGWTDPTATSSSTNVGDIVFATATAPWGTVVSSGLYDAITGGNLYDIGTPPGSTVISTGATPRIPAGQWVSVQS